MTITIKCDCGNNVTIYAVSKKVSQFRDELNAKHFYYDVTEVKESKSKEMVLRCDKCKNWITLGMD